MVITSFLRRMPCKTELNMQGVGVGGLAVGFGMVQHLHGCGWSAS